MADAYLLDTNIASVLWDECHKSHVEYRRRLAALGDAPVFVSVVTLAEVEYGLRIAPHVDDARQENVRARMRAFEVLGLDRHVVEYYAELRACLFRQYGPKDARRRLRAKVVPDLWERSPDKLLGIQENDLWLASAAIERNLVLVSNDRLSRIQEAARGSLRMECWD